MNRAQRRAHARLWPVLAIVMSATLAAAVLAKASTDRAATIEAAKPAREP